jgi:hypothetical protein
MYTVSCYGEGPDVKKLFLSQFRKSTPSGARKNSIQFVPSSADTRMLAGGGPMLGDTVDMTVSLEAVMVTGAPTG